MIYMMTPNYESQKKKKVKAKAKNKNRNNRKASIKLLLSFVLVVALMLTAWIQEKSSAGQRTDEPALQDFAQLTEWGDKLLQGGSGDGQWSFRWDLLMPSGTMEEISNQVFRTDKGTLLPKNIRNHGDIIDGEAELTASTIKLVRTQSDKLAEKVTITLLVEADQLEKLSQLKDYVSKLHQILREKDQNLQMSMKVFGKANNNNAIESLKQLAVAQTVEEYRDQGTRSVTLFTARIKQYRWLNNEKMANLQVSLHENSITGEYDLTIGVPLISGEFGEVVVDRSMDGMSD